MPEIPPYDAGRGGRHGRRSACRDEVRSGLVRLALFPAVGMGLLGGMVLVTVVVASPSAMTMYGLLAVTAFAAWLVLVLAARAATRMADALALVTVGRVGELRSRLEQAARDVDETAQAVRAGHRADPGRVDTADPDSADPMDQVAAELSATILGVKRAIISVADHFAGVDGHRRFEAITKIAWRWQSLVHRQIQLFDELENLVEDPELLGPLWRADHLATRMRRLAESLAVVGGAVPRRQLTEAVSVYEVVRSAVTAVEYYGRVKVLQPAEASVAGMAVANAIHLLAELIENATMHSRHEVTITTSLVAAGLAIDIDDRGVGMPANQQQLLNRLLDDPSQADRGRFLQDGRLGLYVVAVLAHRHGIKVALQSNVYGGTRAVVVLPRAMILPAGGGQGAMRPSAPSQKQPAGAGLAGQSIAAPPQMASPQAARSRAGVVNGGQPGRHALPAGQQPDPAVSPSSQVGDRTAPDLPQRRPQQSLAPELRDPRAVRSPGNTSGHTTGLMGDFRAGWRRSEPPSAAGEPTGRSETDEPGRDPADS